MKIEILGKFYDNQSLSIINRNIAMALSRTNEVSIVALDSPRIENKLDNNIISSLKKLEKQIVPDVQIRHSYPPIWVWPEHQHTKVVYIQPWEFTAMPSEWQYKFDTFADAVVVPSTWNANVYKSAGINPSKIFTIPNGYDPKVFSTDNRVESETLRFLYVGCSQFRKGIDVLLSVWSQVTKSTENIELVIKDTPQVYGKNSLLQDIIKLQHKTKCAKIRYLDDAMTEEEMANMYKNSDVVVHPYRGEGFGMHIQEALACGCIAITTLGGPTDEFTSGLGILSYRRAVNPYEIFALKQGDSMSNMGQHHWVLEPDQQDFARVLRSAINKSYNIEIDNNKLTTWDKAGDMYRDMLAKVVATDSVRRVSR